jgi:hypothetical protein
MFAFSSAFPSAFPLASPFASASTQIFASIAKDDNAVRAWVKKQQRIKR